MAMHLARERGRKGKHEAWGEGRRKGGRKGGRGRRDVPWAHVVDEFQGAGQEAGEKCGGGSGGELLQLLLLLPLLLLCEWRERETDEEGIIGELRTDRRRERRNRTRRRLECSRQCKAKREAERPAFFHL